MQISCSCQDKIIVSYSVKRNVHNFNKRKVDHVQLFHAKAKPG